MTYSIYDALLRGRTPIRRRINHNTWAVRHGDDLRIIGIIFHHTEILTFFPNGDIRLASGGYRSASTKSRINEHSPARVFSRNHQWYVSWYDREVPFEEGMVLSHCGDITRPSSVVDSQNAVRRELRSKVIRYCSLLGKALPLTETGFQCPKCETCLSDEKEQIRDHIEGHIDRNFLSPSLVRRALVESGFSPHSWPFYLERAFTGPNSLGPLDVERASIARLVKKYLYRILDLNDAPAAKP